MSQRSEEKKEKVKKELQSAAAVSLTADVWTSINMEAYLAVTCHYLDNVYITAENLAQVRQNLLEEQKN